MDTVKKQRIKELEKEYLRLSKKEAELIRLQQNYLINYPVEIKILKEPSCNGDIAKHEINLIDFKCKKVVETTNIAELNNTIQQFLQEKGKKLEEKGLLPKPTPPMFYINFVETVGVGQSETAVHSMVDFFLLIQLAGTGDELQGIKRGIMEMADGIVINKADGSNIEKAKLAASHFRNALHLFPAPDSGWSPKVMTYSGFYGIGIKEIWDMIYEYFAFVKANGYFEYRRNEQAKYWMYESINEHLRDSFYNNEKIISMLAAKEEEVLNGKLTSFVAAKKLLDAYFSTLK